MAVSPNHSIHRKSCNLQGLDVNVSKKKKKGHANHILPWFEGGLDGGIAHSVCAVADCDCECANI